MKKSLLVLTVLFLSVSHLLAQVPSYVPTDGLVGWWPFNGNANDESGNGNDGVVNGATLTEDRFGNAQSAYDFSALSANILTPLVGPTGQNSRSIGCWFYTDSINNTPDYRVILRYGGDQEFAGFTIALSQAGITVDAGATYIAYGAEYVGGHHHLVVTYDVADGITVGASKVFLDGTLLTNVTATTAFFPISTGNTNTLRFGPSPSTIQSLQTFYGSIDDIGVWDRALSVQEIQSLFNAPCSSVTTNCTSLPSNLQQGLVGYWPFCGNANDESGNGNDGVVNGATLTEDRFGNAGSAYSFNGSGNFIEAEFEGITSNSPRTLVFWAKTNSTSSMAGVSWGGNGSGPLRGNRFDGGFNYAAQGVTIDGADCAVTYESPSSVSDGSWHQYAFIMNQGDNLLSVDVYQNGILLTNILHNYAGNTLLETEAGTQVQFGRNNYANAFSYFSGALDDIAIYNRALSQEEITELYTGEPVNPPAACTPLPANLQDGLVGYWPFCGNANDESGNGNDGVVNGATLTEDRFGNANAAYGFDGVDDWVETSTSFLQASNPHAISMWWQTIDSTKTNQTLFNTSPHTLENCAFHYSSLNPNPAFDLFYGLGSGGSGASSWNVIHPDDGLIENTPSTQGQWHHLVWSKDDQLNWTFYADGQLVETFHADVNVGDQLANLRFGAENNGAINGGANFKGNLDDIAVFNRALTPEEVQELYTLDACTFTIYDTLIVENVINVYDTLTIENIVDIFDTTYINVEVYDTLTVENIVNVYDTLTIESVVTVYDTTFTNVENIINVYDTTYTNIENVIDVYDTTTVVETVFEYDTLTIENIVEVYDTLTVENVIDVYDTTTVVETVLIYDTLTVENVIDVYDTTYVTVTDTLIINVPNVPNGVGGTILNTLLLYPNPTSDQLIINYGNFAAMAGYSLSIFDNVGNAVHEETNIWQAQETLDISQWSAGVYQVVVYNTSGVPVETRQIVIQ